MKIMTKITVNFLLFILAFTNLQGQNTPKTTLWKIEGDSIKTSYLFGTIHIIPQENFKISEKLQSTFDASSKVVLEIDMADSNLAKEAMKSSLLKEGDSLSSYMDDEEYKLLDNYLQKNSKIKLEAFNKFKPFALSSLISMVTYKGKPMASYEVAFVRMSKKANKEIDGLETIADQIKAIDTKPYSVQLDEFIETIKNPEKSKKLYQKILELYLAKDLDKMQHNMIEFMNSDSIAIKKFLDERNLKWIPKFRKYSKKETVLYAVGAAHLAGENGLLNLLKKEGYTLTPIFD